MPLLLNFKQIKQKNNSILDVIINKMQKKQNLSTIKKEKQNIAQHTNKEQITSKTIHQRTKQNPIYS